VLDKTEAEEIDPVAGLLKLSVIDPACGSGHFLLAAARRIATRVARIRAEGTPSLADFRHALRDVARSCLHGVDRNPMAVELTKVALWIETVDPGLPLGFFDAQIRCGDALLGVFDLKVLDAGVPDTAYKPLTGDDKEVAKYYAQKNKREQAEKSRVAEGFGFNRARDLLRDFEALRAMPEDTVEHIEAKAHRLRALTAQGASAWQLETACDLYVAAFLLPKTKGGPHAGPDGLPRRGAEMVPTSGTIWEWLRNVSPFGLMFGSAVDASRRARAFHWPLEFPDIMQRGGFDVVLGNPPWDVMQLSDNEFFAASKTEIAEMTGARRKSAIEALRDTDPDLFELYQFEKRLSAAATEFSRSSDRFPQSARGKINTFALFADLFFSLCCKSGRSGAILPAEITTSETLSEFMNTLRSRNAIESIFSFENEEFVFPGIANVVKFCLMNLSKSPRNKATITLANYLRQVGQITDGERLIVLSPTDLDLFAPTLGTLPILRTKRDAELATKVFSVSHGCRLCDADDANGWKVSSRLGLFNMATDSSSFLEKDSFDRKGLKPVEAMTFVFGERTYLPVYEGKFISHFDHRFSSYHNLGIEKGRGGRGLPPVRLEEYQDPDFEVLPRYWIDADLVRQKLSDIGWAEKWLWGWRDVANAKVERTVTMAIMPSYGVGHTCSLIFPTNDVRLTACLCANFNSLILDYSARQIIGGSHVTFGYISQLVLLRPTFYTQPRSSFVIPRVLELSYTSHSLAPFARDLGYDGPPFAWDEDRRAELLADLDAFYARAYDLSRDELRYILDPSDVKGPDYPSETFRVLKEKETRQFGEYRTRRLVLEAWDRMEADGTFASLGLGVVQTADAAPTTQRLAIAALPDRAWLRAAQQPNDAGAALTAILKDIDGPTPTRTVRLAAAMILEPHLLTSLLPEARAQEWRRLVGQEAEPRTGNVVGFASRTNQGWGTAVANHRGNGRLIENLSAGTWAPGVGLDAFDTAGWPDGRAGFVLEALRQLDLDQTVTSMPDEVRGWISDAAAA
jgi:hypothetical protein